MKKISCISVALFLLIALTFGLAGSSVFAYWQYYGSSPQSILINVLTAVAPWEGSETLPNDTTHGKNHVALIDAILNGEYVSDGQKVNLGLNTGSDSYLNNIISDRKGIFWRDADQVGSMDLWEDDSISNYFELNEATNELAFMLVFPDGSDDTYYLYTTSVELGASRAPTVPIGTNIYTIFRTTLKLNAETGKWEAVITEKGYAPSKYYANPILGLAVDPAFDTDNWKAGELGTSTSNAIYANTGMDLQVSAEDEQTPVYYTITKTSQTNVKLTVAEGDSATVKVYDSSMKLVSVSAGAQGSQTLTFKANRNAKYYIEVVGDTVSTVTVSTP
ncbi:MAG: hypothetical protein IJY94_05260 [Clostridia bacterium]|nr:hypothetical protein [Clostridia bacterium]